MAVLVVWAAAISIWVTLAIVGTWRIGMLAVVLAAAVPGATFVVVGLRSGRYWWHMKSGAGNDSVLAKRAIQPA